MRSSADVPLPTCHPSDRQLAVAGVEADRHAAGAGAGQAADQLGRSHRRGAEHDPRHAGVPKGPGGGLVAHASARLHRAPPVATAAAMAATTPRLTGVAGPRRVEVDHVDPPGTRCGEGDGDRDRVVAVDRLAA